MYGLTDPRCAHFAKQCLVARRLVERGVRFVQIYSGGEENEKSWDGHSNIRANHSQFAGETDQPIGLLVTDVGLPNGMNGRQLADAARATRPDLPVLFVTGYAESTVLNHGDLAPGMHIMIKPFDMNAFAHRVKNLTDRRYASWGDPGYTDQIILGAPRSYEVGASFKW